MQQLIYIFFNPALSKNGGLVYSGFSMLRKTVTSFFYFHN